MCRFRFPLQFLLAGLALAAGPAAGCSTESTSAEASLPPANGLQDDGASSGSPQKPIADAAPARTLPYFGNPLCHVHSDSCMPDADGYQMSASESCVDLGVATEAGAGAQAKGCRITRDKESDALAPDCVVASAVPNGGDGATCSHGEDCAPGFDCVASDTGVKTCRHYCCSGSCKGNMSNTTATFCDVQPLVDAPQKAPVCMPLKRCSKLLGTGECGASESCSVVTESGDTGCVAVGDRQVGQSCDDSHCAAKLTCLGQPGARQCFKLCKVNASDCPNGQTCVTSAAFQDADFGICK